MGGGSSVPLFGKRYRPIVSERLGHGAQGRVYRAHDNQDESARLAIKLEVMEKGRSSVLRHEIEAYEALKGLNVIPVMHWGGCSSSRGVKYEGLVLDLLGPSLADVRALCVGKTNPLSTETCVYLLGAGVRILEEVHGRGWLSRDLKPANLVFPESGEQLKLVDLGLACPWRVDGVHVEEKEPRGSFTAGTPLFASPFAHKGHNLSRRDDMISLGFVIGSLATKLPWVVKERKRGSRRAPPSKILKLIREAMEATDIPTYFSEKVSPVLGKYMEHVLGLGFSEDPDYHGMRAMVEAELERVEAATGQPVVLDWE